MVCTVTLKSALVSSFVYYKFVVMYCMRRSYITISGVCRISFRGGGSKIILGKGISTGAFWSIFAPILYEKFCKTVNFYIKIIQIALMRTIFRGIGAYRSQECLFIVQFDAFWSTFPEI